MVYPQVISSGGMRLASHSVGGGSLWWTNAKQNAASSVFQATRQVLTTTMPTAGTNHWATAILRRRGGTLPTRPTGGSSAPSTPTAATHPWCHGASIKRRTISTVLRQPP